MGVALVTGGTSGIGAAFARKLAARGHDIILVARDAARLESTAASLRTTGVAVEIIAADLGDRTDVAKVAARLEDAARPIDIFVNNAGFGIHSRILAVDTSEMDRGIEVMIRTVLVLSGAAARGMLPRHSGVIINLSSTAGYITMGAYSAIKAWVLSFTEGLAVELRGSGITVTALAPGWVRTEFHQRAGISASKIPNFLWLDAEQLVDACLRDVDRGKVISIPTVRYRGLMWLARHAPKSAIRSISGSLSSSRREDVAP